MPVDKSAPSPTDATVGELVNMVSEQTTRLVRAEARLAQTEMTQKTKKVGLGAGLFGVAGVLALIGVGALAAAGILGLALVIAAWAAALIVAGALLAMAGVAALAGKNEISRATPPLPTEAARSTKDDVAAVKEGIRS